jgi:lycopene beta-cyclase
MSRAEQPLNADLLILGGGCAGLSLATRLATRCPSLKVIVIEPRTRYEEDRTWCGWRTSPHPYMQCVAASWPQWRLMHGENTIERESAVFPYEMIPASRFYEQSFATIHSSSSVSLAQGSTAESLTETSNSVDVRLGDGRILRARWVVDTRPAIRPLTFPSLWQNFVGYEVQGDSRWTARLGTTPILMDFQPAGGSAIQFMYILPLGDHRFLCEWTRFSKTYGETEAIEADLNAWLHGQGCEAGMIGRREFGSLPMSVVTAPAADFSRIVPAGTLGGSMRASTGYAFHSIQRWADACADSLAAGKPPTPPARNATLDFLDQVFLAAIQDSSRPAETIFLQLFERTRPDALVRFLSGIPQAGDILPVMLSLPWIHFSKAALKTLRRNWAA